MTETDAFVRTLPMAGVIAFLFRMLWLSRLDKTDDAWMTWAFIGFVIWLLFYGIALGPQPPDPY